MKRLLKKWGNSLRKRRRRLIQSLSSGSKPDKCIIVASNGRSGSTLTYQAIREALALRDSSAANSSRFVARLKEATFEAPLVYKTHDFPDALAKKPCNVRVLFCFGSAKDSAFSVYSAMDRYGAEWVSKHFYNLHATGTFDDLFKKDVLQQARQIKEWATFEDVPVMCVHYDAIWDYKAEISEFIGMEFQPPARKDREPKRIPDDLCLAANQVYDPIDRVIGELPKVFLASKEYKETVDKLPN
ncbi:hypothetical protein [Ruegeria arenilitoris]|uniref:hypothetical protein n=1 Tax=Ruegeria arenilitoris TaxID=1173585 RepID=UPI00147B0EBA|nr:hypothetical protein [Ruegeria arenilitoris]